MGKDSPPAFPFYARDYLVDDKVTVMTPEQRGGYVHLLCHAWLATEPGVLPDDDRILAALSGLGDRWPDARDAVLAAFTRRGGRLIQKRMVEERAVQALRFSAASEGGRRGAKARWSQGDRWGGHRGTHAEGHDPCLSPFPSLHSSGEVSPDTPPPGADPGLGRGPASEGAPLGVPAPPGGESPPAPPELRLDPPPAPPGDAKGAPGGAMARFWAAWPRGHRVGRRAAETALQRALKRGVRLDDILAGVERAKASDRWVRGFIKDPSTWLNQDCCYDETTGGKARGRSAVELFTEGGDS